MARSFNGSTDFINCGNSATLNPTTNLTIMSWMYQTSSLTSSAGITFARDDNTLGRSYALGIVDYGSGAIYTSNINGTAPFTSGGTGQIMNQWVHLIALTSSGTGSQIWVNGAQSGTSGTYAAPNSTTGNTTIGERTFVGAQGWWPGRIADVAIWNVALTPAEILALSRGARPFTIREPALLGYWPLDGLQSPEPDLSGFAHNGTLNGTTAVSIGAPVMMLTPRTPLLLDFTPPPLSVLMPQILL